MNDEELRSIVQIYGTDNNEVKYLEFINDGNPFRAQSAGDEGRKTQYIGKVNVFEGETEFEKLIFKLKAQVKKDRIRL
jgi:hypothetical protein